MFTKSSIVTAVVFGGLALSGLGIAAWSRTPVAAQDAEKKPAPESPNADNLRRDAAQRFQTINNLKQIMLAMHNYESTHGSFPAAAIYGKEGQPLLSWRVAILPFLEQAPLYAEFHKDEPWDSPHNKTLWGRMPNVFKTPYSPAADHATRIRGFQGAGAMFEGPKGARIADITDGTSNTIMLTVSNDAAVWTKPGDLPFIDGAEIVGLDEADPLGYLLATGDGSVHTLPKNAKGMPGLLRKMITRNGGEIIELPDAQPISTDPRPDATGAVLKPTAAVGGPGGMSAGGSANATTPPTWNTGSRAWKTSSTES